jgi:2-polyprenyl-3-methyl-5-hydroxy-6-metoxy-1,4-benzoquinol methylase
VSGTSKTLQTYFYNFALYSLMRLGMHNSDFSDFDPIEIKVLDIACNDGSQLDEYEKLEKEHKCFKITRVGIDPAENIYDNISKHKNHDIYCEYFTSESVSKLKEKYGAFDIIIAQNVFAHIDNPSNFLANCKELMKTDFGQGILLIQTSQKNMILNAQFDTVYHEHLSFFNTNSMKNICQRNSLHLNDVMSVDIHGTSYLFEVVKTPGQTKTNVIETIYYEMCEGLYSEESYSNLKNKVLINRNNFHNRILEYVQQGKQVIGIGSTAKSNVLLNFCQLSSNEISVILDENILKQGLLTPGSDIEVKSFDYLQDIDLSNTVLVIFAWNFFDEIKRKVISILNGKNNKRVVVTFLNISPLLEQTTEI